MNKIKNILAIVLCGIFAFQIGYLIPESQQSKYTRVVNKVMPAVVEIQVTGIMCIKMDLGFVVIEQDRVVSVLGSGVYVSPHGYILTCAHLFSEFKKIKSITVIAPNDDSVAGKVKQINPQIDLALVKVDYYKTTPYVKLADPRKLELGQEVVAIGSPLGLSFSVSNGIISALYRDFPFAYNVTQSNTAINPGNSGGPLFNLKGELVGINVFVIPPVNAPVFTGLGFSVQSGQCLEFLAKAARKYPDMKESPWKGFLAALGIK